MLVAVPVSAHVTLEVPEAALGSGYEAVFKVPHGCAGSPTVMLRLQVPEGVIAVKPMPKPGWTLEVVKGKCAKTYIRLPSRRPAFRGRRGSRLERRVRGESQPAGLNRMPSAAFARAIVTRSPSITARPLAMSSSASG